MRIQEVTDEIAESLGMDRARGALVAGVTEGGPAEDAKIEAGDVIIEFNGTEVPDMQDLPRMVADTPVGEEVSVVVLRKGEEVSLNVTLGRLEEADKIASADGGDDKDATPRAATEVLGMTLAAMSDELREKFSIGADVNGVVVTEVAPDSPAAEKRISAGDVIVEIAQESVATPEEIETKVKDLKDGDRRLALFLISNAQGEVRFIPLQITD